MRTIGPEYGSVIEEVANILARSHSIFVITGAGLSADSGLPTYRGIGGLYNINDTEEGMPIEELLSGETWETRPELTWKYLGQVEKSARGATFNRAHKVIAEMEAHFDHVCTLTQNIDGFHHDAGAENVLEIHGNMREINCIACNWGTIVSDYSEFPEKPKCPRCGDWIRPSVVLFGEMLPEETVQALQEEMYRKHDIVFIVGTTAVFPYIAAPVHQAVQQGIPVVEINPGESDVSNIVTHRLPLGAAQAMDAIWNATLEKGLPG